MAEGRAALAIKTKEAMRETRFFTKNILLLICGFDWLGKWFRCKRT
jgi:hypothetical protein